MSNVAFIGLGVMGYPMAGYISKAGHNVTVYNRTAAKAEKWVGEYKGSKATSFLSFISAVGIKISVCLPLKSSSE